MILLVFYFIMKLSGFTASSVRRCDVNILIAVSFRQRLCWSVGIVSCRSGRVNVLVRLECNELVGPRPGVVGTRTVLWMWHAVAS